MRHEIAMALASERAFEANATRRRTRRGGPGRTRVQRPGGGSWTPGIYLGLADANAASDRPPEAPIAFQSTIIFTDPPLLSGATHGSSPFPSPRCTAASTEETGEWDEGAEEGREGSAGEWDAAPGSSGSSSDGGEGLEFPG